MQKPLTKEFIALLQQSLPMSEATAIVDCIDKIPAVSIRINRHKIAGINQLIPSMILRPIVHCEDGFLLSRRISFTGDPAFHAGGYYVQEANSMVIGHVAQELIKTMPKGIVALDLCGAPGGKSTHISSVLRDGDLLVANETIASRCAVLLENLCKWGQANHVVTNSSAQNLGKLRGLFHLVLADMPCSGEGMFRKNPTALNEWSIGNVQLCSERQQRIAHDIWPSIAEGGYLVYSTCTYNKKENENNINGLLNSLHAQTIKLAIPKEWNVLETEPGMYRMMPHQTDGEGFFFSVLQKTQEEKCVLQKKISVHTCKNLPAFLGEAHLGYEEKGGLLLIKNGHWFQHYPNLPSVLPQVKQIGINAGLSNKKNWKPHSEYDLMVNKIDHYPIIPVDAETALRYYKREFLPIKTALKGGVGLRWKGLSLGTANALSHGLNNLWPMSWRILNQSLKPDTLLI
ncbi:MAG: rRNA cytosine-C5-methyltransferase [Bacteroidetes bacterium]|nr:rRNA cytosine-C5-methyltransferase [Bacteroidota bacterium]